MPEFLSDPSTASYTILGAMVIVSAAVAARRRKKADVAIFLVSALLLAILAIADKMLESPRETTGRVIQEMTDASHQRNYDELFKHVSESFKYNSLDKKGMRDKAKMFDSYFSDGFETWDVQRSNFKKIDDNTVEQGFLAQPRKSGNPAAQRYVVGTFKKEGDTWKLTGLKLYNPLQRTNAAEEAVPGL